MNIPLSCKVDKTVFKKLFYENANLSTADKSLFTDIIDKVTWLYCLKPETINVQPFKDDIRDYPEIEVIEVVLTTEKGLKRIAEIVMRTIPYPMLLIFRLEDRLQFWVAHQRTNLNDSSKNTIDEMICSDWVSPDDALMDTLDIRAMRFINYFTLYSDIVDAISIYNAKALVGEESELSGEAARKMLAAVKEINRQIVALRAGLKKETQFNRKLEINIQIKKLEQQKCKLLGGAV
ncbi:MAG: DUF4391 domain-containing protein [Bacteroidales bacterium]|nr:DUF4391 domain-containing protein [Bacteroidales bacterium]